MHFFGRRNAFVPGPFSDGQAHRTIDTLHLHYFKIILSYISLCLHYLNLHPHYFYIYPKLHRYDFCIYPKDITSNDEKKSKHAIIIIIMCFVAVAYSKRCGSQHSFKETKQGLKLAVAVNCDELI